MGTKDAGCCTRAFCAGIQGCSSRSNFQPVRSHTLVMVLSSFPLFSSWLCFPLRLAGWGGSEDIQHLWPLNTLSYHPTNCIGYSAFTLGQATALPQTFTCSRLCRFPAELESRTTPRNAATAPLEEKPFWVGRQRLLQSLKKCRQFLCFALTGSVAKTSTSSCHRLHWNRATVKVSQHPEQSQKVLRWVTLRRLRGFGNKQRQHEL